MPVLFQAAFVVGLLRNFREGWSQRLAAKFGVLREAALAKPIFACTKCETSFQLKSRSPTCGTLFCFGFPSADGVSWYWSVCCDWDSSKRAGHLAAGSDMLQKLQAPRSLPLGVSWEQSWSFFFFLLFFFCVGGTWELIVVNRQNWVTEGLVKEETRITSANQNKKRACFVTHCTTVRITISQKLLLLLMLLRIVWIG